MRRTPREAILSLVSYVDGGETNSGPASMLDQGGGLSFFFLRRSFASPRTRGTTNEQQPGKYSGFWLSAAQSEWDCAAHLLPAFISAEAKTGFLAPSPRKGIRIQLQQRNCLRVSRSSCAPVAKSWLAKNRGGVSLSGANVASGKTAGGASIPAPYSCAFLK